MTTITGTVKSGLGEGAYFMSIPHYKKQFIERLGFEPFEGTLNIESNNFTKDLLNNHILIEIPGFEDNNKKFGGVTCYKASIKNIEGALVFPHINKQDTNTIEFISKEKIRDELKLQDNDQIKVHLQ